MTFGSKKDYWLGMLDLLGLHLELDHHIYSGKQLKLSDLSNRERAKAAHLLAAIIAWDITPDELFPEYPKGV